MAATGIETDGTGLQEFVDHVNRVKGDPSTNGFEQEFLKIKEMSTGYKRADTYPSTAAKHPVNRKKNRYKDIVPFDYTRVHLPPLPNVEGSDYVNASYLKGTSEKCSVIAAMGPLPHTVDDFWRMVWSHYVKIICMCARVVEAGRQKCAKYWPDEGFVAQSGNIKISNVNVNHVSNDFCINSLTLECDGEVREVTHFQYFSWPDHGVPARPDSIMLMLAMLRDIQPDDVHPVVIHCSAGCGRTGTLCAIDYTWSLLKRDGLNAKFNVFNMVARLRQQRQAMVQTKDQYVFVYKTILYLVKKILDTVGRDVSPAAEDGTVVPVDESEYVNADMAPSLYVNIHTLRNQARAMSSTRMRALTMMAVPSVDEYVQNNPNQDNDEEDDGLPPLPGTVGGTGSTAFLLQKSPSPAVSPEKPKEAVSKVDETGRPKKEFFNGDTSFPNRTPRPLGPRNLPQAWGSHA